MFAKKTPISTERITQLKPPAPIYNIVTWGRGVFVQCVVYLAMGVYFANTGEWLDEVA